MRPRILETSKTLDFGGPDRGMNPTIRDKGIYKEKTGLSPLAIKISIPSGTNSKWLAAMGMFKTCHCGEMTSFDYSRLYLYTLDY